MDVLNRIFNKEYSPEAEIYYIFGNADGKRWVMPRRNMRMAMNLYQPSSRNGRMVKSFFPISPLRLFISKKINSKRKSLSFHPELMEILRNIRNVGQLSVAAFGGTPGPHCKTMVQVSTGKEILGYCKITENPEVAELFDRECSLLRNLHAKGVTSVPKPLYRGKTSDGLEVFVQSTVKTRHSKVCHRWTQMHDEFLRKLESATSVYINFEDSDFFRNLDVFRKNSDLFPLKEHRAFVDAELKMVMQRYAGKHVNFCTSHGDFTPWNTFAEGNQLYVFDWEYGNSTYPKGLDKCHFLIQTAIFEEHLDSKRILKKITGEEKETVKLYLLDIIARYSMREQGTPSDHLKKMMNIWVELLQTL